MTYLKINPALLEDYDIGILSDEAFREYFNDIIAGGTNKLSKYVQLTHKRLPWKIWQARRVSVFKRDNYTCQYCGEVTDTLECDHIIPISKGGSNDLFNLATSCVHCNRVKKDRIVGVPH